MKNDLKVESGISDFELIIKNYIHKQIKDNKKINIEDLTNQIMKSLNKYIFQNESDGELVKLLKKYKPSETLQIIIHSLAIYNQSLIREDGKYLNEIFPELEDTIEYFLNSNGKEIIFSILYCITLYVKISVYLNYNKLHIIKRNNFNITKEKSKKLITKKKIKTELKKLEKTLKKGEEIYE
ncbi:MAG: hypothetical protein R3Y21_01215 [Mycoplasmatota bacterium]